MDASGKAFVFSQFITHFPVTFLIIAVAIPAPFSFYESCLKSIQFILFRFILILLNYYFESGRSSRLNQSKSGKVLVIGLKVPQG